MAENRADIRPQLDQEDHPEAVEARADARDATGGASSLQPWEFNGPSRMLLTDHERHLAINIKEAIAANPEVDSVTDFMCAQLALIEGDNIEGAIARAYHLQCFREEYGIRDTAEDGKKCFADYVELFPGAHLALTYYFGEGNYVMVYDNANFDSSRLRSDESIHCWLGGTYYTCTAFSPDFEAIRKGVIIITECEG
jgi:hypothetical protein